jgi:pyridoxal biosynthesis lyase PdxS
MRQWAVPPERLQGLGVDVMAPPEVMSPAQLEKAIGKATFAATFAPMVESISSGLTLVPDSDKRTGTEPGAHTADKAIKAFTQGGLLD